jgi:thioredoxin-like negative regulator of GroEL
VENIPLNEAVARGIIPCSTCGASGADVRKVGNKNHMLCARCIRRSRFWTAGLTALAIVLVGLAGFFFLRSKPPANPDLPPGVKNLPEPEHWMKETSKLMKQGRFKEVRERTQDLLEKMPKDGLLNITMGRCLLNLGAVDAAIPYLQTAAESQYKQDAVLWLGMAYKKIGHAAQALTYLEEAFKGDPAGRPELAEIYLDLERFDDALKILSDPDDPTTLWARHRALVYLGKGAEARKLFEGRDDREVGTLKAGQLREEGDFEGARKVLESLKPEPGAAPWHRVQRGLLSLAIESGQLEKLDPVVAELSADKDVQIQGEAIFARAMGALLAGQKDRAKTAAWEFLARTDKEFSPLRLERMMMRHLVGELKVADLEAEAKLLSRFHANDLLWYLALATGDRAWAEKAAASTPGHNYPYHSIQRLLKK